MVGQILVFESAQTDFLADFAGWHGDLQVLIRNAERCFRWGFSTGTRCRAGPMDGWRCSVMLVTRCCLLRRRVR